MAKKEFVNLNQRRQLSFANIGNKEDTLYIVEEWKDGAVTLTPASVVPKHQHQQRLDAKDVLKQKLVRAYGDPVDRVARNKTK